MSVVTSFAGRRVEKQPFACPRTRLCSRVGATFFFSARTHTLPTPLRDPRVSAIHLPADSFTAVENVGAFGKGCAGDVEGGGAAESDER